MDCLEWVGRNAEIVVPLVVAVTGSSVVTVSIPASAYRKIRLGEAQLVLQQSMAERGLTPDDIERVFRA